MFGLSVPYSYLKNGGDVCGEFPYQAGSPCPLPAFLSSLGVASAELRTVESTEDPNAVLAVAKLFFNEGIAVTVHGRVHSAESAVSDVFGPIDLLIKNLPSSLQTRLNVTVHPIDGADLVSENVKMLTALVGHILGTGAPVSVALENNRLLPDHTPGDSCALVGEVVAAVREKYGALCGDICRADSVNPIVGVCFDMGHYEWYRMQIDPLAPYIPPDRRFLENAIHTHIHGISANGKTHHPLNPDREIHFADNLAAMEKSYAGLLNIELEPPRFAGITGPAEAYSETVAWLRGHLSEAYKLYSDLRATFRKTLSSSLSLLHGEARPGTRFSLPTSTFYVFDTNGTKWVMDPSLRTAGKITGTTAALPDLMRGVDYIVVSHAHEDHFEKDVVRVLAGRGFRWVIPDFMLDRAKEYGLSDAEIIPARAFEPLSLGALTVTPFPGRHFRPITKKGIPCMGYLVTAKDAPSLLFPGDIRDYSVKDLPALGKCDAVFAHVWLGDGNCMGSDFPLTDDFVRFFASFGAKKVFLTHLYESGRDDGHIWRAEHAERLIAAFSRLSPETEVLVPPYGEILTL